MSTLHADALAVLNGWPSSDPLRARFLQLLHSPESLFAQHPAAHVTASAVIVHPDRRRVLLCLHGRFNKWVQVGGHCEPGDTTLHDAALREAREESGLHGLAAYPEPIDLDIHAVNCRHGADWHYDVRYAVLATQDAAEQVSDESHALGWFTADALPTPLANATARLIPLALRAFT